MCHKNVAPLGLEYIIHTSLQEFRPAAADSNTRCLLVAVLLFCLSAPEERYSCRKYMCIVFESAAAERHSCKCHLLNKLNIFNYMVGMTNKK